jgi:hypothetical protein
MEMLVVLLLLVALNVAVWRGWGVDSRDNQNWDPGRDARQRSPLRHRPDRLDPAQPHLAARHPDVVTF